MTWQVDWTAPASSAGAVTLYCVGVAANGTGNTRGDWVYLNSHAITNTTTPVMSATWGEIKRHYR